MREASDISRGAYKRIFGVLFHLTKRLNSGAPLDELLRSVAESASDLVGADSCAVMLFDDGRTELLTRASSGLDPADDAGASFRVGEGVAGWVARTGAPAIVGDATEDPRFKPLDGQRLQIASMVCVPLTTKEGVIGTLTATSARANAFGKDHEELLTYLGSSIVKDIENARLYRLSITDSLTKAYNRQFLYQRLPDELERARRYGDPFSVVLFDIDHFKAFNDTHGHAAGDFVLKEMVRIAQATIREVDGLVRYGGEEFLMLLPRTPLRGAAEAAERLRAAVERAEFRWGEQPLKVTLSLGVTCLKAGASDDALLRHADELLYRAKREGRNRVVAVG